MGQVKIFWSWSESRNRSCQDQSHGDHHLAAVHASVVFRPCQVARRSGFIPPFYLVHYMGRRPPKLVVTVVPLSLFAQDHPIRATDFLSTPHCQVSCLCGLLVITMAPIGPCQFFLVMTLPDVSRAISTQNPTQDRSCGRHCMATYHATAGFCPLPVARWAASSLPSGLHLSLGISCPC